jgi:hypothetical protein
MPSTSAKQHRFMEAVAHNPAFAKKAGIPQSVGQDFAKADKGKTFEQGGATMMKRPSPKDMMAAAAMRRPMAPAGMAPRPGMGMKEGGMPMKDGKPAFMMKKKMMGGGMTGYAKGGGIESKGKTKGTVVKMASGGNVSSRADGIAQRGKTKFTMC